MRVLKFAFVLLLISATAFAQAKAPQKPQTEDLGMGAFSNEHGAILLLVDASLADLQLKSPYIMFILYMASKDENVGITVEPKDVVMVYNGQEYQMPSVKDLRANYGGTIRDADFYRHLGKEGIVSSWVRFYNWNVGNSDFFPPLTLRSGLPREEGYMYGYHGFRTKVYFKNPGFKKGDLATIKVHDNKNPNLAGEVTFKLD